LHTSKIISNVEGELVVISFKYNFEKSLSLLWRRLERDKKTREVGFLLPLFDILALVEK